MATGTSKTTVVNIREGTPYEVYIGRGGKWGNPYIVGKDGSREECIAKYEQYLIGESGKLAKVHELTGKVLGCYCKPLPCHGDILARYADGK